MNLKFKNVYEEENIKLIKDLYRESFPKNERFEFKHLIKSSKRKYNSFFAVYDNNNLIGLTYLTFDKNIVFILYLSVSSKYRDKGYGSQILRALKDGYKNHDFILDIEALKEDAENYEQRLKRVKFYEKNGFYLTNLAMQYKGEEYEYMCTNKNLNITDKLIVRLFSKLFSPLYQMLSRFYRFNLYNIRK